MEKYIIMRYGIFIFYFVLVIEFSFAQEKDYEKWLQEQQRAFRAYIEESDKLFLEYLRDEWKRFSLFSGAIRDTVPKPDQIPRYEPPPIPIEPPLPDETPIISEIAIPEIEDVPFDIEILERIPVPKELIVNFSRVRFYNQIIAVHYSFDTEPLSLSSISGETIADYWETLANKEFEEVLARAQQAKKLFNLNDWGYLQLLYSIANELHSGKRNETYLTMWFFLQQSGYFAQIGYTDNRVYLFMPSQHKIYGIPYFFLEGTDRELYIISFDDEDDVIPTNMYTYIGEYGESDRFIDLSFINPPRFGNTGAERTVTFSYNEKEYDLRLTYDTGLVEFYRNYPQTEPHLYFTANPSHWLQRSLAEAFKPIIDGKTEVGAVSTLLRFVQNALEYKTDLEQFGKQKYMFPDEIIYYDYSDCDDRAILFAYLVRSLLGLEVIGLDYPGHVATAVRFSDEVEGDKVYFNGSEFTVCDPTFIDADIGMTMPALAGIEPEVIPIDL